MEEPPRTREELIHLFAEIVLNTIKLNGKFIKILVDQKSFCRNP